MEIEFSDVVHVISDILSKYGFEFRWKFTGNCRMTAYVEEISQIDVVFHHQMISVFLSPTHHWALETKLQLENLDWSLSSILKPDG